MKKNKINNILPVWSLNPKLIWLAMIACSTTFKAELVNCFRVINTFYGLLIQICTKTSKNKTL